MEEKPINKRNTELKKIILPVPFTQRPPRVRVPFENGSIVPVRKQACQGCQKEPSVKFGLQLVNLGAGVRKQAHSRLGCCQKAGTSL